MADKLKSLGLDVIAITMKDAGATAPEILDAIRTSYGIDVTLEDVEEVIGKTASVEDLEKLNMMIDFFFAQFKNSNEMIAARVGAAKMVKELMELKFKYGGKPKNTNKEEMSMDAERVRELLKEAGFKFNA